jgi:TrmH family RNA methyltransferase
MSLLESITNNKAIELRELVREADARRERGMYVVEGPHLVETALEAVPRSIQSILITPESKYSDVERLAAGAGVEIRSISQKNAERISDTRTTQGVFAIVRIPKHSRSASSAIVALDDVQDPGNVGTIIRTALWFGVTRIIAGSGTADCYSPKVTRATQGGIFGVEIEPVQALSTRLVELKKEKYSILGSSLSDGSIRLQDIRTDEKYVIVLGSEAHGLSREVEDACDSLVRIERGGKGESLNVGVSAGILLAKLTGHI